MDLKLEGLHRNDPLQLLYQLVARERDASVMAVDTLAFDSRDFANVREETPSPHEFQTLPDRIGNVIYVNFGGHRG